MPTTIALAPTVTIHADGFDSAQAAKSVLCLEVGRDRFRLLVQDVRGRAVYLDDYTFPSLLEDRPLTSMLPEVFRDHPILATGPWQEVRIGVNSPSFTLVPEPLYRKEYASSYLALMRGSELRPHEFAQAYTHQAEGFLSVFSMEHSLADYFSEAYPLQPLLFVHQIGALIQATADLDRRSLTADAIYLYFEDEFITILYRKDHALRYCNRFGYKNVQDMAYYVLYVLDELAVNTESTPVILYGEITPFAEGYTELSKFLPHLSFGQPPSGVSLAAEFADLPDHRYLSLYGLSLMSE